MVSLLAEFVIENCKSWGITSFMGEISIRRDGGKNAQILPRVSGLFCE